MRKLIITLCSLFLIFLFIGTIGVTSLHANLIVFYITKCEKTGRRQLVYEPNSYNGGMAPNAPPGSYYVYEIKIEWYLYHDDVYPTNLWRSNQPGAYANGNRIFYNVSPYNYDCQWSWLYMEIKCASDYRRFDWVPPGTWYYQAEFEGETTPEESETVP